MKRFIIFMLFAIVSINMVIAQGRVVTGYVNGDAGPLESATVAETGVVPANVTQTDKNGRFSLTLRGRSNKLEITAINFLRKEVSASGLSGAISLDRDPKSLEDVVVVAYGRQKKLASTSAVSSVRGDVIRQNPSASLQNGLVGRMPGFSAQQRSGQPGSDGADFFIRGTSSYNGGGNTPLVIVDDIEYQYDQFKMLDANEVESISVLKDASSTAVYGIKGANGVVIVTTRRGKQGPARVSFSTEYASLSPTTLPRYLDAAQTAILYDSAKAADNRINPNPGFVLPFSQADIDLFRNGLDPYGHPNINWKKVLFKDYSHQTKYNLDISGGTERVKYFVSVGFLNQGGILNDFSKGKDYNSNYYQQRFNYRSNLDITVTKDMSIKLDIAGSKNEVNNPYVSNGSTNGGNNNPFYEFNSFLSLSPFAYPITNPDGSWGYSNWQLNNNGSYNGNNLIERLTLGGYTRTYNDNINFATNLNQKLDFITKGLSLKLVAAYTSNYTYGKDLTRTAFPSYIYNPATGAYTVRANVNSFNNAIGDFLTEKLNSNYNAGRTFRELSMQGILNYDHYFGTKHHVYGLYLFNRDSKWQNNTTALAQQYNYIPVNFTGQSVRLGYDFREKYLFQLNVGYNGTDRFGNGKRFGTFPAASIGYNIAEEDFFKKAGLLSFINVFKLRASYGIVGSDILPSGSFYSYRNDYVANGQTNRNYQGNFGTSTGNSGNVTTSIQEGTLSNENVTWEKEKQLDLGLDFSMFNKKLSGSVDIFNRNRYDILTTRGTVSTIFGANLPPVNLGKVNNRGYELELTYADKIGKNFTYSVRGTYAVAINKVIFSDEPTYQYAYQQFTGRPVGDPRLYKWTGHYYTDAADIAKRPTVTIGTARPGGLEYEDINGDGVIDANDRGFFAKPNLANTNYGFSVDLHYKGFGISALFQGIMNGSSSVVGQSSQAFISNLTELHTHAWTPALGDAALYPWLSTSISNNSLDDPASNSSTFWTRSTNYLRLRTMQVSYQLPSAWLNKLKIKDMRLYVNGNNLLTWSDFEKTFRVDPEVSPGSVNIPYPTQKAVNIGLNVTF